MGKFGWCFVGAGNIAHMVADDSEGICVRAVCARHFENAERFAKQYGATAYRTVEEAVLSPGVEGVYVATQHPEHNPAVLTALRAGKSVLCEKPMGVNAKQVREMIKEAKKAGKFLSEAMWPRYNPVLKTVKGWIESGQIGQTRYLHADFAESVPLDADSYVFKRERAGGALLDMGIYPLAIAQFVFGGAPESIRSESTLTTGLVDQSISALLKYSEGRVASVFTSIGAHSTYQMSIHGTKGVITVPEYWRAREATCTLVNGEVMCVKRDGCRGYGYQMRAVEEEMRTGMLESPEMPLGDTLALAEMMDELRRQAGVEYEWD